MYKLLSILLMLVSLSAFSQTKLTAKEIFNKKMLYDFGGFAVDITISSDSTLYWKDVKTGRCK